jgi:dTDP-L-rhamnose 4-epimerase
MKVLITGGAGFIGSHTSDTLLSLGHEVRIIDCLQKPLHLKGLPRYIDTKKIDFVYGDVCDKRTLRYAMNGVDVIFHFAAYQDYLPYYSAFTYSNAFSTSLLFEIIEEERLDIKKVIVASSQAVMGEGEYKNVNGGKYYPSLRTDNQLKNRKWNHTDNENRDLIPCQTNETIANPQNPYAMSKYHQEMLAINLGKRIEVPTVALRYSIVHGARQSFYNTYSGACRIFSLNYFLEKQPRIFEDGKSMRDYINVHDVVDANILVMESDETNYEVYNVGGGKTFTVLELANAIAECFGSNLKPIITSEYRFGDTRHIFSDISKLKKLGWSPTRTIYESIEQYKNYLESQTNIDDILDFSNSQMRELGVIRRANF